MTRARPYDGVSAQSRLAHPISSNRMQFGRRWSGRGCAPPLVTDFGSSWSEVLRCSVLPAEAQELAGFRMHVIVVCAETEIEIVAKEFECTRKGRSVEMKRLAP